MRGRDPPILEIVCSPRLPNRPARRASPRGRRWKSSGSRSKDPFMTRIIIDALVPIFAGLLLGYIAGRRGLMDNRNVRNLIVLVMNFAIPCALFSTILGSSRADLLRDVPASLMITLAFSVLYLISYLWARRGLGMSLSD